MVSKATISKKITALRRAVDKHWDEMSKADKIALEDFINDVIESLEE